MALTTTTNITNPRKKGAYINYALQRNEFNVIIEPSLTTLDFDYGIPLKMTDQAIKYIDGNLVVIKADATTPANEVVGFTKNVDRDPNLFFVAGALVTAFKGTEEFYKFTVELSIGAGVVAGDLLEFNSLTNTYITATTGTPIVRALEDGAGEDLITVQSLI